MKRIKVIDFAGNLNPYGPPVWTQAALSDPSNFHGYPELWHDGVDRQISENMGIDHGQAISIPGTSSFIFSLPALLEGYRGANVQWGVLNPSFWEYREALRLQKRPYKALDIQDAIGARGDVLADMVSDFSLNGGIDAIFLSIPNNPTGQAISPAAIKKMADSRPDAMFVLDLTYAYFKSNFQEYMDLLIEPEIQKNIICFASLSKFFALPGLRVGFAAFGDADLASHVKAHMGPVRINSLAEKILPNLLLDNHYINTCRLKIEDSSVWLRNALSENVDWLAPMYSDACFGLYKILPGRTDEEALKDKLEKEGVRVTSGSLYDLKGYVRIRTGTDEDNSFLLGAINNVGREFKKSPKITDFS